MYEWFHLLYLKIQFRFYVMNISVFKINANYKINALKSEFVKHN